MHKNSFWQKLCKWVAIIALVSAGCYGVGRLYYRITDGFTVGNISSNYAYDSRWDISALSEEDSKVIDSILSKPFTYLGKGCQSYVFLSQDGNYILKFFKYQRFRPQAWLDYLTFFPGIEEYRQNKIDKKQRKLEGIFNSWKIAYEDLRPETQLVYIHLNKSKNLNQTLTIYDKMGFEHRLEADNLEFLLQRKAKMLCHYINELMANGNVSEAQGLLSRIIHLILSEYQRGLADNDHALMQNTGVYKGNPIHIDVGQFVKREDIRDSKIFRQELFNKTYKFRLWLKKNHPDLLKNFESELRAIIGDAFDSLKPHFKPHDE